MIFILMKCYVFCWLLIDGCTVYSWGELFDICTYYFFTEPSVEETLPAQCENLGSGWNMGRWFICKWMPLEILLKSNSGVGWHVHFYFRKMWRKQKKNLHTFLEVWLWDFLKTLYTIAFSLWTIIIIMNAFISFFMKVEHYSHN